MKKLLLVGLVALLANAGEIDLLKVATNGKVNGENYVVAEKEAKNVKAGWYSSWFYNSYLNPYSSYYRGTMHSYVYARAWRSFYYYGNRYYTIKIRNSIIRIKF